MYQEYDDEVRPRRRLRGPVIIFLVMAISAGGLWIAYSKGRSHAAGEVPLIQADQGAVKTRPQQPGGMAIPDQDKLVYNQGKGQPAVEKLLPPPETPLPRPAPAAEVPSPAAASPPVATPLAPAPPSDVATAAPPVPSVAQPLAPAAAATPPAVAAGPVGGAGYRLQLGALRSEESARQEWNKLRKANNDLLGSLTAAWPRADLGERGIYYRIQAGPIADGAAAERLCGELKRRSVSCILVRP